MSLEVTSGRAPAGVSRYLVPQLGNDTSLRVPHAPTPHPEPPECAGPSRGRCSPEGVALRLRVPCRSARGFTAPTIPPSPPFPRGRPQLARSHFRKCWATMGNVCTCMRFARRVPGRGRLAVTHLGLGAGGWACVNRNIAAVLRSSRDLENPRRFQRALL